MTKTERLTLEGLRAIAAALYQATPTNRGRERLDLNIFWGKANAAINADEDARESGARAGCGEDE